MKPHIKTLFTILFLIGATGAALAYMGAHESTSSTPRTSKTGSAAEPLRIEAGLVQDKVLQGSDGLVSISLTLIGADTAQAEDRQNQPVDLVVVLDRSGSMQGLKMDHARSAVIELIRNMDDEDRIGIITYANHVQMLSSLTHLSANGREQLAASVRRIVPSGGTNLGGGLETGINTLTGVPTGDRQRKIILVSDGLANHGITAPRALGAMAARATEFNLGVTTVGVGYDFNEVLMTTIADHGAGNYYFLENPAAFGAVLENEFETTRIVTAGTVEVSIPLPDGVQLVDAGGYPIGRTGKTAVIRPGDILAGQQRTIFLTFQVPTRQERSFSLGTIQARYRHQGEPRQAANDNVLVVSCVSDRDEVIASIDRETWSTQVVREEYNRLKNTVADAIRTGKKEAALDAIDAYKSRTSEINQSVGSAEVKRNLESEVTVLQESVQDTFAGAPAAVAEKQKQQAKKLQYDSYRIRRDKQ